MSLIPPTVEKEKMIRELLNDFVLKEDHPCLMAQTVFTLDKLDLHTYENFGSRSAARDILHDLGNYISRYDFESNDFYTFLAVFQDEKQLTEIKFEQLLWQQLQFLHEEDDKEWDPSVNADPDDPNFSFSLGGRAFYMVGMHPNSSRRARRTPFPTIAFNLHWQFERLREMNSYETVRDKIRERDIKLQGHLNPMLEDFGTHSEARQYSGRKVGEEWKCPFLHKKK